MNSPIDLSRLPPPTVVEELDFERIYIDMRTALLELAPELADTLALESEPLTKILQICAYRELLVRQRVNEAARAVMLAYAAGSDLDHLAALFGVERHQLDAGDPDRSPPIPPTYESDDALRRRVQLSLDGYSTAGPAGAYVFHALSADPRVLDASVSSPTPGVVIVTVLAHDEPGTPDQELLSIVDTAVNADEIRPLTDHVLVQAADIVSFEIDATLYFFTGPDRQLVHAEALAQLQEFLTSARRLGRDIPRSALHAALHVSGVQRVVITNPPDDIDVDISQAAWASSITLHDGGVHD